MDLIPPLEFRSFWDDTLRKAACIIAGSTEELPESESDDGTLPDGPGLLGVMDDYNSSTTIKSNEKIKKSIIYPLSDLIYFIKNINKTEKIGKYFFF